MAATKRTTPAQSTVTAPPCENSPPSASDLAMFLLEKPIEEIDALSRLLCMVNNLHPRDRYNYEVEDVNAIVLQRIKKIAAVCRNRVGRIIGNRTNEQPAGPEY